MSGNAKMAIVCCITPANAYIEETRRWTPLPQASTTLHLSSPLPHSEPPLLHPRLPTFLAHSTLQFASRAKLVSTHATVNEVLDDAAKVRACACVFDDRAAVDVVTMAAARSWRRLFSFSA